MPSTAASSFPGGQLQSWPWQPQAMALWWHLHVRVATLRFGIQRFGTASRQAPLRVLDLAAAASQRACVHHSCTPPVCAAPRAHEIILLVSQRIAGKNDSAIRSLAWLKDPADGSWRLISAGLDAVLEEWDLQHLRSRSHIDSYGGAVWDMAVEPARAGDDAGQSLTAALRCTAKQQGMLHRNAWG